MHPAPDTHCATSFAASPFRRCSTHRQSSAVWATLCVTLWLGACGDSDDAPHERRDGGTNIQQDAGSPHDTASTEGSETGSGGLDSTGNKQDGGTQTSADVMSTDDSGNSNGGNDTLSGDEQTHSPEAGTSAAVDAGENTSNGEVSHGNPAVECSELAPAGLPGLPIYPLQAGPHNPMAAYLDNDEYVDLVVPSYLGVQVLFGRGNGHFAEPLRVSASAEQAWSTAAVSDLDADGHTDFVLLGEVDAIASVLNDGVGWFTVGAREGEWRGADGLALGDFDGDGHPDVATVTQIGARVGVSLNQGDGSFAVPSELDVDLLSELGTTIAAVDVTGDHVLDLIVSRADAAAVGVLEGNGDGTFNIAVAYLTGILPPTDATFASFVTADFDADDDLDVAITAEHANEVMLLSNDGTGAFEATTSHAVSPGPRGMVAVDFDGEAGIDLAVASAQSGHISVLLNTGTGDFAPGVAYIAGPLSGGVAAADLNGDDAPDLVVANQELGSYNETTGLTMLFNLGDGSFAREPTYVTGTTPYALSAADLDANGTLDLVVANQGSDDVSVLLNQGEVLSAAVNYAVGARPSAVITLDCDGDGTLDVVSANAGSDDISVRTNDGHGVLGGAVSYAAGDEPSALAHGDFDGDGAPDVAVTARADAHVGVLINRGDCSFAPAVEYETDLTPVAVVSGDFFDADGVLDLAVANEGSLSINLFRNLGDGSFEALAALDMGSDPGGNPQDPALIAYDLFNDGNLDLIAAIPEHGTLAVFYNENGGLNGPTRISVAQGVNSLSQGDLDGDGASELLMTSSAGVVFALRDRGDGFFEDYVVNYFRSGSQSRSIAPGDWNGDGRLDLAVANPNIEDNVVRVLLNGCAEAPIRPPPAAGLKLNFTPSDTCRPGEHASIGNPAPDQQRTSDPRGVPMADGEDRWARVLCSVAPTDTGFRVRADVTSYPIELQLAAPNLDDEGRGVGQIRFFSSEVNEWMNGVDCTIETIGSAIAPDTIWASFTCPNMAGEAFLNPQSCAVSGEVLLEQCDSG